MRVLTMSITVLARSAPNIANKGPDGMWAVVERDELRRRKEGSSRQWAVLRGMNISHPP